MGQIILALITGRARRPKAAVRQRRPSAVLEALEERVALSATPIGNQFDVSGSTVGRQSAIAMDPAGDFVVGWTSEVYDSLGNFAGSNVMIQRYDARDNPLGSAVTVNTSPILANSPSVAMDSRGDFIVSWYADYAWPNGQTDDLYAQRFDSSGNRIGAPFRVNELQDSPGFIAVESAPSPPRVAMDPNGDFVFTWTRNSGPLSVFARTYNSSGAPTTDEFLVNNFGGDVGKSWVAMDAVGDFVVSFGQGGLDPTHPVGSYFINFQRYNSAAQPQGQPVRIAESIDADDANNGPSIGMDSNGDFVIAWANSLTEDAIYAQVFNPDGSAHTSIITIADFGTDSNDTRAPYGPNVTMDGNGDWVITWSQASSQFGPYFDVEARQYNLAGTPQSDPILIDQQNPFHPQDNLYPAVAMDSRGDFTVAWELGRPGRGIAARSFLAT